MKTYVCKQCGKHVQRDCDKAWMKSYCEESGRTTRLWLVKEARDPFYNDLCNCESMGGRLGAHRPECPTMLARAQDPEWSES